MAKRLLFAARTALNGESQRRHDKLHRTGHVFVLWRGHPTPTLWAARVSRRQSFASDALASPGGLDSAS